MTGGWTIRDVDQETIRRIKAAAALKGMTLAQYLAWLAERLPA